MIVDCGNGDLGLLFKISEECAEVLGDERVGLIDAVIYQAVFASANSSLLAAITGAHRWPTSLRPEVLIDATGRML